ncbi:abortive infection protein [Bradyrhizobium sp. SSBR45G]|uniref:CPBP family intramembrane glutamic endopeptidase n=1 Tax=unclassified Bradyrhizobium TaxID=2631580 RepID=UPI00234293F8|nr:MULTISPECIES: type II CAAX endopeptidase family protein [unclassified Bradyrhizobium]GLH75687.1 abortive infection protein [Bradyrhizobium sp. SSBR45G]GLH85747.1 abortive infection protein [Bradyrhizobium sp. SSBR45R]
MTQSSEAAVVDSLDPANLPQQIGPAQHQPRTLGFWWTALWGFVIFIALFAGQAAVVGYFMLVHEGPVDASALVHIASRGLTLSLSVIMGLPAVLLAVYFAVRHTRTPFAEYLGLRWTSWKYVGIGIVGMIVIVVAWDLMSRATGREISPGFMLDVLKTAKGDGTVWLMVIAFCVAAPLSEELFARGFLYRGWSDSFLRVPGAIILSSLVWTAMHLQYDWYFFLEVFALGLWFGYLRSVSHSTGLTIVLHGLNNLAATVQTMWLAAGNS